MAKIAYIIREAAQKVGVYTAEGDAVPGDIYLPMYNMLRDIISELNSQNAISFGKELITTTITGDTITFQPYTAAEQAIIDGGGSVDITDRIVTILPDVAPDVYVDSVKCLLLSYSDLLALQNVYMPEWYAFNRKIDKAEILFPTEIKGKSVKILHNIPLRIDDAPYGDVHVPETYVRFVIAKLIASAAQHFQFEETAMMARMQVSDLGAGLATNNMASKPIKANLHTALNKFRRYSR